MSLTTKIAFGAALILGTSISALAAGDGDDGGFRELSNGGAVTQGVNPADHRSLSGSSTSEPRNIEQERQATEPRERSTSEPERERR